MKTMPCHCCDGTGVEIDHRALGKDLRTQRMKLRITLMEMANRLQMSAPYLSDLERGNRRWSMDRVELYKEKLFQ